MPWNRVEPVDVMVRIQRRLVDDPETGCRLWTGATSNGYGIVQLGRRGMGTARVHVVMWEAVNGPKPKGMDLCHSCDRRACVNLDHLRLGTRKENMADAVERNRVQRGEAKSQAVLTESDVREIRASHHVVSAAELALRFGVSRGYIYTLQAGKNWRHVA